MCCTALLGLYVHVTVCMSLHACHACVCVCYCACMYRHVGHFHAFPPSHPCMQEPLPTVELFLLILLECWNGEDYKTQVFKLLSYTSLQHFDGTHPHITHNTLHPHTTHTPHTLHTHYTHTLHTHHTTLHTPHPCYCLSFLCT